MMMRARQEGEVIILELEGQLDFETTVQFKETCAGMMKKQGSQRVVFNLEKLKFVGSSGINQFIRVLKEFNTYQSKPRYCRLSAEFQRVFRAYQTARNPFEIHEDEPTAIVSFDLAPEVAQKRTPRPKKLATA